MSYQKAKSNPEKRINRKAVSVVSNQLKRVDKQSDVDDINRHVQQRHRKGLVDRLVFESPGHLP